MEHIPFVLPSMEKLRARPKIFQRSALFTAFMKKISLLVTLVLNGKSLKKSILIKGTCSLKENTLGELRDLTKVATSPEDCVYSRIPYFSLKRGSTNHSLYQRGCMQSNIREAIS